MSKSHTIIVFDTETTGFSPEHNEIVQLSYILYDTENQRVIYSTKLGEDLVNIKGNIPQKTTDIHGITKEMTIGKRPIKEHIDEFIDYCNQSDTFVGHNIQFDINMIVGQIHKFMHELTEEEKTKYKAFLEKFAMNNKKLPENAYCTMDQSKEKCAALLGTKTAKKRKLIDVHRLLFNQEVGGQLHNALVDISVTLRVYIKLTMEMDICHSTNPKSNTKVAIENEICSLIRPYDIHPSRLPPPIPYDGELITGIKPISDGFEEHKVMVQTLENKMASELVTSVVEQAKRNASLTMAKNYAHDCGYETIISVCSEIIKQGKRKGETCGKPVKYSVNGKHVCGIHKSKGETKIKLKGETFRHMASKMVGNILKTATKKATKNATRKKNTIVPMGGRRKKTKRKSSRA